MQTTQLPTTELGRTGLEITRVGFGAWAIGGAGYDWGWGTQEDDESVAAIHHALELGVNWIDTAAAVRLRALRAGRGPRARGSAASARTCSRRADSPKGRARTTVQSLRRDSLRRELEGSLSRLGVDAVDLYQIHWPIPAEQIEEGWSTLAELKERGPCPPHRRLQLQCRTAAADPADRSRRDAAAALLAGRARGRGGAAALRRAGADRRDRLLADGIRPADRRDDPRADRAAARGRLAQAQRALPGAAAVASTSRWSSGCRRSPTGMTRRRVRSRSPGRCATPRSTAPSSASAARPGRPDHHRGPPGAQRRGRRDDRREGMRWPPTPQQRRRSASSAWAPWAATWQPGSSPPATPSTARSEAARTRTALVQRGPAVARHAARGRRGRRHRLHVGARRRRARRGGIRPRRHPRRPRRRPDLGRHEHGQPSRQPRACGARPRTGGRHAGRAGIGQRPPGAEPERSRSWSAETSTPTRASSRCCASWARPRTWARTGRASCSSSRSTSAWPCRCSRSQRACSLPNAPASTAGSRSTS